MELQRVYTDERFPQLEVHNSGGITFRVFELDPGGRFDVIDEFVAYERAGQQAVSEPFAKRRAEHYFEHMSQGNMSGELETREVDSPTTVPIKNLSQRLKQAANKPLSSGVDPLKGMREMTQQDVDSIIAQAQAEQDPVKKAALKQQALSMMAQQESTAQRVVKTLLNL